MIVVAGEALVDLVIDTAGAVAAKLGGGPYNVARTIGRLGRSVTFLGAISNDRFGSQLFAQLAADGVSADATVRTDLPTTLAAAELNDHGAATYHFYLAGTSAPSLTEVPAAALAPEAVHAGTLGLALEPMASTLVGYLQGLPNDTMVMIDPNCRAGVITDRAAYVRRVDEACRRADVVKVSNDDTEYLAPGVDPLVYARALTSGGVALVLVTCGADGTWVITAAGEQLVPAQRIEVADTIGAGDSFGGGFLTWWLGAGFGRSQLADPALAAQATAAAQAVAGITCRRVGADPPRRAELPDDWHVPRP
ncbi:MAG TPA: carbohydrate kinase [Ilumatobacteraceae bacterium]|nr:carbohydrate kinase [Ilumatobacteraceae bacterium]